MLYFEGVMGIYNLYSLFDFDIEDFNIGVVHHNKRKVHYMQKEY